MRTAKKNILTTVFFVLAMLLVAVFFTACADTPVTPVDSEEGTGGVFEDTQDDVYSLSVMSYNLASSGCTSETAREKVLNNIRTQAPDLLGVQEENRGWEGYLEFYLAASGYAHVYAYRTGNDDASSSNEATGIFYKKDRFELLDSGTFWLSDTPDVMSRADNWGTGVEYYRVCTFVKLKDKQSDVEFAYFNTHFGYENVTLIENSAKLVVSKMQAIDVPVIFSGDLNFASNDLRYAEAYKTLTDYLTDTRVAATEKLLGEDYTYHNYGQKPGEAMTGWPGWFIDTAPIDYIFIDESLLTADKFHILTEEGTTESDFSSDHFAIYAELSYTVPSTAE